MGDIEAMIRELTEACEAVLGISLTDSQRRELQVRVVNQFGGERIYVPKRANFVVGGEFDLSGSVQEIMRRHRISRRQVFRLRKKKR